MQKLEIAKTVVRTFVSLSTSATVGQALRNNVPVETVAQKVQLTVGCAAVGAMAGQAAGQYTDKFIDELAGAFRQAKANASE